MSDPYGSYSSDGDSYARTTGDPATGAGFPLVRRGGYDKDAVDAYLNQHRSDLSRAQARAQEQSR